jgi:hypothetical protein
LQDRGETATLQIKIGAVSIRERIFLGLSYKAAICHPLQVINREKTSPGQTYTATATLIKEDQTMLKQLCVMLLLGVVGVAFAATGDDLAKNAESLIGGAERSFFANKIDEANETLDKAGTRLEELKSQAPDHKSLKNLQNKHDRLKQRIDEKRDKAAVPGKTAAAPATSAAAPAGGSELKSGAKSTLQTADKEIDYAGDYLEKARESIAIADFNKLESHIYSAESHLQKARDMFDRLASSFKTAPDHPAVAPSMDRYTQLKDQIAALKQQGSQYKEVAASAAAAGKAASQAVEDNWLPRIQAFTQTTGAYRIQSPAAHDPVRLAEQDQILGKAKALIAEYERDVPADAAGSLLSQAAEKLRFEIKVYEDQRIAAMGNLRQPVVDTLGQWEKQFAENRNWQENSQTSLFIVRPDKIDYLKKQIAQLAAASPGEEKEFSARLAALEKENSTWMEKRMTWESRPRPFPEAKMTSIKLQQEMTALLKDRGWKVNNLVIVDKDWWVLQNEYRYMQAAALSEDASGPFWSFVSFRQMQTLAGYGATEIMEIKDKIRLP